MSALFPACRPTHLAWGFGELWNDAWAEEFTEFRIPVLYQHVACPELVVLKDVGNRVDGSTDHASLVEDPINFGRRVPRRPSLDQPFQLLLVFASCQVRRELRVVGEIRL